MKHTLFTIMALMAFAIGAVAEEVEIQTKEGKKYIGELRGRTDSTLTIYNRYSLKTFIFYADEIVEANTAQGGRFTVENGKIVGNSYEELYMRRKEEEKVRMGDPNYAIGKALKSTGTTAMIVGVPSLFIGTILVSTGFGKVNKYNEMTKDIASGKYVDTKKYSKLKNEVEQNAETLKNCQIAGCVLMPFGGALTLVGVPLYVHGKQILEFAVQVNDNGAGVAVKF